MPGVDVIVQPTSLDVMRVEVRDSWAPSSPTGCYFVRAFHVDGQGQESEAATMGSVADCVEVPEPDFGLTLALGFVLLVGLPAVWRRS